MVIRIKDSPNSQAMTKAKINEYFVQYLPNPVRGRKLSVQKWRIVKAILYKLKTGIQWCNLPMREFFGFTRYSWESVYYHFNRWGKLDIWAVIYTKLLWAKRSNLDMSSINLDGSHTPAKRGGHRVGYQGRKKSKMTNMLILTDNQGVAIGCSEPISGEHNDSFELVKIASEIFTQIKEIGLSCEGLFLNADAGFDTKEFRKLCFVKDIMANIDKNKRRGHKEEKIDTYIFDKELYDRRFVVEQLNAWVDGFKTLSVRYETSSRNWMQLHCIAFAVVFLRKYKLFEF